MVGTLPLGTHGAFGRLNVGQTGESTPGHTALKFRRIGERRRPPIGPRGQQRAVRVTEQRVTIEPGLRA